MSRVKDNVVVLNADNSIINIVNWKRAIRLILMGRAVSVEESDKSIQNFEGTTVFKVPSIIRLLKYVHEVFKSKIKFSKKHIFIRDGMKCAYCGSKEHLTLDHVKPRALGGKTTWENIVTSCSPCNRMKGSKPLERSGLTLKVKPHQPNISEFLKMKIELFGVNRVKAAT